MNRKVAKTPRVAKYRVKSISYFLRLSVSAVKEIGHNKSYEEN
jgi:hypothetical protein